MKLTRIERWILANQLHILGILDPEQHGYYEQSQKIIEDGYEYLYGDCIQHITPEDQVVSLEESKQVIDILDMFRGITFSLRDIEDKTGVDVEGLEFDGFDANTEGNYYAFAKFYCSEFEHGRFQEIGRGSDDFNSHYPVLGAYKRMLDVWYLCANKHSLTKEELIKIRTAGIHPENR